MLVVPLPTPFDLEGIPDWDALQILASHIREYVDGVLLFGSNGEAVHLTPQDRLVGLTRVKPACPMWVGCGDETVVQARQHLAAAHDAGATAALVTPPRYYARALGSDGLQRYFTALADADEVPVWLYHIPQLTRTELPVEVVERLAAHPRVAGIKDSSGDLSRLAFYTSRGLELTVCTGHASTLLGALALGAGGAVLAAANLAPLGYRGLMEAWERGDIAEAQRWQRLLEPLGRMLGRGGFVLLKQAMRHFGLPAGYPRAPYPRQSPLWDSFLAVLQPLQERGLLIPKDS